MWSLGIYELMANERIATYRREAALDRRAVNAAEHSREKAPAAPGNVESNVPLGRRALAAAFVGLVAGAASRWKR